MFLFAGMVLPQLMLAVVYGDLAFLKLIRFNVRLLGLCNTLQVERAYLCGSQQNKDTKSEKPKRPVRKEFRSEASLIEALAIARPNLL